MRITLRPRPIILSLLATAVLSTANPLLAQSPRQASPSIATDSLAASVVTPSNSCPAPMNLALHATSPNIFQGDFVAAELTDDVWLNYSGPDKHFVYTFQWKPAHQCCQITRAVLTVKMQANQGGQSTSSSDAGNDNIAVMHLGAVVLPYSERIYSHWPFPPGQQVTKTWTLTGAALANINAGNRLSIYVEDDTMVKSATLQLIGCCLSKATPVAYPTKEKCEAVEKGRQCSQLSNGTWHAE